MVAVRKILCPVDLSVNSLAAVELATSLAKLHGAKLVFFYIAPQWLPKETIVDSSYVRAAVDADRSVFLEIRPMDPAVQYDHKFMFGNPGPEIVRAAKDFDLIVISTHGRGGLLRLLVGSVAQYVMRHAKCPVIVYKCPPPKSNESVAVPNEVVAVRTETVELGPQSTQRLPIKQRFVTDVMHHVGPLRGYHKMDDAIIELHRANQTGAPVIDEAGTCIGILTQTDIEEYRELQERLAARDETVVDEIFETDEFGQRRAGNSSFDLVSRHLTSPVITVSNDDSCETAHSALGRNSNVHHLVVVDESNHPLGILESADLYDCRITVS